MRLFFMLMLTCGIVFANILQNAIDNAKAYSTLNLKEGIYEGNIIINKPLTIKGENQKSIILGDYNSTVIKILSSHVTLKDLHVKGSGDMHQSLDGAILVKNVQDVKIINNLIDDSLFGIDFDNVSNSFIISNKISSKQNLPLGLKGDGVRLWYSNDNEVKKNSLINSRDMVVWYSHGNVVEENFGQNCRYSLHFMYTGANVVKNNKYINNSVGIFFMYSRDTIAKNNVIQSSLGSTGMGIGLKEASGFTIENNTILYNAQGIYIDWSPYELGMPNIIKNNNILYNSEGIRFHSKSINNKILQNNFIGNLENVVNDTAHTDINKNEWLGNFWDNYEGFDTDKNGIGDTPYMNYYYADSLWLYNPSVKFFYASPIIGIVNFLAKLAPFSEPVKLFEDKEPSMYKIKVKP